jgi:phospholipid/cholesterol/gamma-HCH transport system substrate-binding protein
MKRITVNFMVGIFVLIGIGAISFLALKVAATPEFGIRAEKSYTLYANFNNIGSLKISAPVKISGFVIGRVSKIALNTHNYEAIVTMQINDEYKFSTDTSAQILTTGLLGEQYVALLAGADTNYLKNGDTITITSSALVLENLIGQFMTNIGK